MKFFLVLFLICQSNGMIYAIKRTTFSSLQTLIPYPEKITQKKGYCYFHLLQSVPKLQGKIPDSGLILSEYQKLCSDFGIKTTFGNKKSSVYFSYISDIKPEAYTLNISQKEIRIEASCFGGFFNALQTLRQMINLSDKGFQLPCCYIEDQPAFPIRGVMLDIGRNYIPISLIKDIARRLSHYKINTLHLHLTDDPGWRIEIKKYPALTDSVNFWPTRQPGKFYTQEELTQLVRYCDSLHIEIIPEIDMPGHSAAFVRATGVSMQSLSGIQILKEVVDETTPIFPSSYFHIGSDEVHFKMDSFMPEMIHYIRDKGKKVVVWHPGFVQDSNVILMSWGENEAGYKLNTTIKYIDCNGFYVDWMDAQSGVLQVFFQQPCETPKANDKALGSILCFWTDGALSSGQRILEQYPFYPCALTFAERIWRGSDEKRKTYMAQFPAPETPEGRAFREFEERLAYHRDHYFQNIPFAYVCQSQMKWKIIGPFDHRGKNDTSFEPERKIQSHYATADTILKWQEDYTYGGAVHIRSLYTMFNMHKGQYQHGWPTTMSDAVGTGNGTCYALTYIESPQEKDIYLLFGLNGMWGHSGGYRTSRAPEQGSWDFSGGDIWLNDQRIKPPHWPFESLPWTGWGKGRIEVPLTEEGYFFRPPVKIHLKKGINKILIRSVFGHWKGDDGERKWFFCCIPVNWNGTHYTEVPDLSFPDIYIP